MDSTSTISTTTAAATTRIYSTPACMSSDDTDCDMYSYLLVLVSFLVLILFIACGLKLFYKLVYGKSGWCNCYPWRDDRSESDADTFYHRDSNDVDRRLHGIPNLGAITPPPRYDQIFKRGGGRPAVITTRQPPASVSSDTNIEPPAYEHVESSRSATTSSSGVHQTPVQVHEVAIDMEHPAMRSATQTIDDIETAMDNIHNHAHACAQRYDSNHADQVISIASSTSAIPSGTNAPICPPAEGGPPCYDTISIRNE